MTLLILTETSAGYALLKAKDKKLLQRDDLAESTETAEGVCSLLKLKQFRKFQSSAEAVTEAAALIEGKVTPTLSSMLDELKDEKRVSLAVADPKLGKAINKLPSLSITPISDSSTSDLYRAIRTHLPSLIPGLLPAEISTMSLGLSHSLSRHKLKFSPDKVDVMVIQAINLLDDVDKELNNYAMRIKEWYGWHFPELARIINDNTAYAKVILKMGARSNASSSDLAEILPEEIEAAVKAAAEVSMGQELDSKDLTTISVLADQVVELFNYRAELSAYLSARMQAIAPNLTALVGDLVGARLISHAGSLVNLAKSPASTIQILGAEKALFRALKTKHDTPKYGLIYHASLIGQATGRNKGKIARMLATKTALGLRVDAVSDFSRAAGAEQEEQSQEDRSSMGREHKLRLERHLRKLENKRVLPRGAEIGPSGQDRRAADKWSIKEARKYNPDADGLVGDEAAGSSHVIGTDGTEGLQVIAKQAEAGAEADEVEQEGGEDAMEVDSAASSGEVNGKSHKKRSASDAHLDRHAEKEAKRARKAEKRARKEEKRAAKEEKRAAKEAKGAEQIVEQPEQEVPQKKKKNRDGEATEQRISGKKSTTNGDAEEAPVKRRRPEGESFEEKISSKKVKTDKATDGGEKKKKKKHKA
ncbi:MAG: hypothetical protein Q9165_005593 [Trypethelium subeluteriae]